MTRKKKRQPKGIYESRKSLFVIPQLIKIEGLRTKEGFKPTDAISPIFGRKVKNVDIPTNKVVHTRDTDTRYDVYRDESSRKISFEEREKFLEFTNIHTDESREKYLGSPVHNPTPKDDLTMQNKSKKLRPIGISNQTEVITKDNFEDDFLDLKDDSRPDYSNFKESNYSNEEVGQEAQEVFAKPWVHSVDEISEEVQIKSFDTPSADSYKSSEDKQISKKLKKELSFKLPSLSLFSRKDLNLEERPQWLLDQVEAINSTLAEFNIEGRVVGTKKGPTVTRYEISIESGVNVKRIQSIEQNLMLRLAAESIRIEAPIPGKSYVGIEVPNHVAEIVKFGNVVNDPVFANDFENPLKVALGVDIDGENIFTDIFKMPHGLIAGATNSGKSVCVNTILISLLIKNKPEDLRMILIDPKMVELQPYNDLPHLITPVITDPKIAATALRWVVEEMDSRYKLLSENRSRDQRSFNEQVEKGLIDQEKMPYILIVIDELADLIQVASQEVEDSIQRITQKARAAGIHLLVATQRPSTDVIKGTIKSNIPTRIAFKVAAFVDSITIIDSAGAEKLLGRGDMLFKEADRTIRLQGAFIPDDEIYAVTDYIRENSEPNYIFAHEELVRRVKEIADINDDLVAEVAYYVVEQQKCSINAIQVEFSVGFNRAKEVVEVLEQYGIVSAGVGTKAREVLISTIELEEIFKK